MSQLISPISKLEKLIKGLTILSAYQAAAPISYKGSYLLVGKVKDNFLPEIVKHKLGDLGFKVEETSGMFAFSLEQENDTEKKSFRAR
jgi:hypothetical protein